MVELDFKSLVVLLVVLVLGITMSQTAEASTRIGGLFLLIVVSLVVTGHIKLKT